MSRKIVHLDADAFFASVEQAADSRLRGKPMAVGGEKRGIIASASYEARKFGVYTPMPTVRARKLCPKLIVVPGDFEKYERFSRWMFSYAYDFTPEVEISSIDEGYFDLSGARKSPLEIADIIRRAIGASLKITVSEGIGANKLVSQIASKLNKPAAFAQVLAGEETLFLHPLANKWLPGIGPKTADKLNAAGLARIGQVAATPLDLLQLLLGNQARGVRDFAHGRDDRPLRPAGEPAKSYGHQETFAADQTDEEYIGAILKRMADSLMTDVRADAKSIRTLTVKVRYNDMTEDQAGESLAEPTDLETDLYGRLQVLLKKAWQRRVSLRMVSLRLSNVYDGRFRAELALDRAAQQHEARRRLAHAVDALRETAGPYVILRGHDLELRKHSPSGPFAPTGGEGRDEGERIQEQPAQVQAAHELRSHPLIRPPGTFSPSGGEGRNEAGGQNTPSGGPGLRNHRPAKNFNRHSAAEPQPKERGYGQSPSRSSHPDSSVWKNSSGLAVPNCCGWAPAVAKAMADKPPQPPSAGVRTPLPGGRMPPATSGRMPDATALRYLPLNVHSYFSFLNSTLSIDAIVQWAARHELPAMALTDDGNLHGAVEFTLAARKAGIKPVLGARVRVGGLPALLYVENTRGYHNLCRLLSASAERTHPDMAPRFSPSPATQERERGGERAGLFRKVRSQTDAQITSSPPALSSISWKRRGSVAANSGVADECAPAELTAKNLAGLTDGLLAVSCNPLLAPFFPGRFYFAVNSREAMRRAPSAWPCVAALPGRYAVPDDRWKFNIVQSIRTLTLLNQEHPDKITRGQLHLRPPAEMQSLFRDHPQLLAHTTEVAERCAFELSLRPPQFPAYPTPDGSSPHDYLRRLVYEGLSRRYPQSQIANRKSQIETELGIIADVGYEEYFLVVWDILQACRRAGIEWITRGSAADSLVCYCLGISGVCPVRFDLYFRRFLNKDRMALNKLPDIDIDFPHDRKDDVVDLIFAKYGAEHCAVVGGFSTFQARSAFAEVAKVLGVAEREVRRFTDKFPWSFGGGWVPDEPTPSGGARLVEMLQASPECADLPLTEPPYAAALEMAEFLDGFPRYPKMHPCGVVLSRQPMHELTPTFQSQKGRATTHFDMDAVEAIGLVKIDILAQGGLAAMRDTKTMLAARGIEVDLEHCLTREKTIDCETLPLIPAFSPSGGEGARRADEGVVNRFGGVSQLPPQPVSSFCIPPSSFPFDDPQVWEMIARGEARAVHHIESPAMIGLSRQCNVREIDGLIAIVSVIRPGAANEGKKLAFTRRYQGLEPVEYAHPSLADCLRSTYGLVVYEEHILQICEAFAGLPPGRADVLRRALNKQKRDVIEEIRLEFFASARVRGHKEEKIQEVWELASGFAGYAFCKAHSTAYGVEAYQAAWLKRYFPVEFMAAVLSNGKGFYHPLVYVLECHRLGITLRPPAVNHPGPLFMPEGAAASSPSPPSAEDHVSRSERLLLGNHLVAGLGSHWAGARRHKTLHEHRTPEPERRLQPAETLQARRGPLPAEAGVPQEVHGAEAHPAPSIRVPMRYIKGLTQRTNDRLLEEHARGPFASLADFYRRVAPSGEELEAMIRVGAFDEFGETRTRQFWQAQQLLKSAPRGPDAEFNFGAAADPVSAFYHDQPALLHEPGRRERLQWEAELLGFPASGHPLELHADIAWDTYCPVAQLGQHLGRQVVMCGLVIEQRTHHQITGEPMKFLTLADWTGMVETELFAPTYRSYGLATVRYPVLEITATVEPFENGRGHSLRVHRAGQPRTRTTAGEG